MDINALKTFLEVARTRHFAQAAENLFVSQSTVSARIRTLEEKLGVDLFVRERGNIHLSPSGEAFITHAKSMMTLWDRAQQEITASHGLRTQISIGALSGLWDISLQDWLKRVTSKHPDVAIKADTYSSKVLVQNILSGELDIAFLYDPPHAANIGTHALDTINLKLVSSKPHKKLPNGWENGFIKVDWGQSFAAQFEAEFPQVNSHAMETSLGRIALEHIKRSDGFAYLAEQAVARDIAERKVFNVPKTPIFKRQAYSIFRLQGNKTSVINQLIELI